LKEEKIMEAQPQTPEPKKTNRTLIIIGGILLACCFLVVVVGLVYQFVIAPSISNTIEAISSTPQGVEVSPGDTGSSTSSDLPSGGLADDTLRLDVWMAVNVASSALGCTPDAAQTTIEVTQDPDLSGKWIEKWAVACTSGGQKAFDVTFTPTAGGGTDYSITTSP
jgi:hypothetical protein